MRQEDKAWATRGNTNAESKTLRALLSEQAESYEKEHVKVDVDNKHLLFTIQEDGDGRASEHQRNRHADYSTLPLTGPVEMTSERNVMESAEGKQVES
jgi:hypothetical protein